MKITYKSEVKDEKNSHENIVNNILKNRNITDKTAFMNPPSPLDIHISDFGYDKEMESTKRILKDIKEKGKPVVVYTDYDADGITGGTILWETLHLLGFKVMPYVPHRQLEGYGFSQKGIDNIKEKFDPALIISVDHGITARDKIAYSKSIGIPVIVTDHHLRPEKGPEDTAEAVFHIPALSGSGVAYFFAKMLFQEFGSLQNPNNKNLENNFAADYMALASIGTVADLVPLSGPSRSVVKHGLREFKNIRRIGLKYLLEQAGIANKPITPYEIGFMIAPRINAIGRLSHAIDALRLLCTTSETRAYKLASALGDSNSSRQSLVKEAIEEAMEQMVKKYGDNIPSLIILQSENWHEGIIGLIASKIMDKYYRPVVIMTKSDGIYKGSARSIPVFHMTDFLRSLKKYLIDVGGHAQAAGFSIDKKNLNIFTQKAEEKAAGMLKPEDLEKIIESDVKLSINHLNIKIARELESLAPFGMGNPSPLFYSQVELIEAKKMGKTGNHIKMFVADPIKQAGTLELVSFSTGDRYSELSPGMKLDVVYNAEVNRWNGQERLNGMLKYFFPV